jgi:proline iminopeptidase
MTDKIEINGIDLLVEVQGEQNERLFIGHHGAPGLSSHAEPKRAFGKLSDRMKVVTFDARGSGESDYVEPYTHEQWVADVDALREHFGAEKFVMGGGSYGGFLSLEYALAHPDRVEALVLRDTAARNWGKTATQNAKKRAAEFPAITDEVLERIFSGTIIDNEDYRQSFAAITPLYDVNYDSEATAQRIANTRFNYLSNNYAFSQNLPKYDLRNRLHEITVPVLITVGQHDWITPVEASEELHSLLPNSKLAIFKKSGHSLQIEEHDEWFATVRGFLEGHGLL